MLKMFTASPQFLAIANHSFGALPSRHHAENKSSNELRKAVVLQFGLLSVFSWF
jgi:hypothetical protein